MIVVAGNARTGTSIIVKCLEKSGYNLGTGLKGHHYKSEHIFFQALNAAIYKCFDVEQVERGLRLYDLTQKKANMKKGSKIPLTRFLELGLRQIQNEGVEVLKDTQMGLVAQVWHDLSPVFRNVKYIFCWRSPLEISKSVVRLRHSGKSKKAKMTVRTAQIYTDLHNKCWSRFFENNKVDRMTVLHEEIVNRPEVVQKKLSCFLDRDIDVNLLDKNMTWKESKGVY